MRSRWRSEKVDDCFLVKWTAQRDLHMLSACSRFLCMVWDLLEKKTNEIRSESTEKIIIVRDN